MKLEIKLDLKERYPALAEAVRIMSRITERFESKMNRKKALDELLELQNLAVLDLFTEMALTYNDLENLSLARSRYLENLSRLISISDRHKELQKPLKDYLLRLEKFSEKNEALLEVYNAYSKALGGLK